MTIRTTPDLRALVVAVLIALPFLAELPSSAAAPVPDRIRSMTGAPGGGPPEYDRIRVLEYGASDAGNVIVLVPGWFGGAGSLALFGERLADMTEETTVWIVERRQQRLVDVSALRTRCPSLRVRDRFDRRHSHCGCA